MPASYTSGQPSHSRRHPTCWASSQRSQHVSGTPCHFGHNSPIYCGRESTKTSWEEEFRAPFDKNNSFGHLTFCVAMWRHTGSDFVIGLLQWCSNFLARGPHLSFRNPSRATRINNLNTNGLKWL